MPPRDVSYSPHALGGVTEHRVYATKPRPPAVTLGMLALHGYAAWRLWHADLSVRALRSLAHWDAAAWRALVSVPSLLLVAYLVVLLRISDQLVYESVTVLPGLGVQVSAVSRRFFRQRRRTRFVPARAVQAVVIHEGLSKWNVHYYLGVVTSGRGESSAREGGSERAAEDSGKQAEDGRVVVAFEATRPPLSVLKRVYHAVHADLQSSGSGSGEAQR